MTSVILLIREAMIKRSYLTIPTICTIIVESPYSFGSWLKTFLVLEENFKLSSNQSA